MFALVKLAIATASLGDTIDGAHHRNEAHNALRSLLELEKAVRVAMELTSEADTLIIFTADHSQSLVLNGYQPADASPLGG